MKALFLLLIILLLSLTTIQNQAQNFRINSYDISTKVTSADTTVEISAVCFIDVKENPTQLQLILNSSVDIHSIEMQVNNEWLNIPYRFNGTDSLNLITGKHLSNDGVYQLRFEYSFPVGKLSDTVLILDRGIHWYPFVIDQISSFTLSCQAPAGYGILSAGNLLKEKAEGNTVISTWESKSPVFKLPLVIFNKSVFRKRTLKNLDAYTLSLDTIKAQQINSKSSEAFDCFNKTPGLYPYNKLAIIEIPGMMGINTCSGLLIAGTSALESAAAGNDEMLILTIAQQWFGAGVFSVFGQKGFSFLNITLPHFLRLMYLRSSQGEDAYKKSLDEMLESYKQIAGKESDIPLIEINPPLTKEKGLILYAKGPYILSKVESALGKEKWALFLQKIYSNYLAKLLTYDNFIDALDDFDSEGDAYSLLKKLIKKTGVPE